MVVFWVGLWLTLFCSQVNSECQAWNSSVPRGNTEMLMHLTDTCRYDRWTRPGNSSNPLMVLVRIHVYFLGSIEAQSLQFTAHILIRLRWLDTRLDYKDLAPGVSQVVSEGFLKDRIWTPHIYLVNEQDSVVMGAERHDLLISVQPDGTVIFSSRMKVTLSCLMDLQKFPFDHQKCPMILESWTYNSSELTLSWESNTAVTVDEHLHLPEYRLLDTWSDFSLASYSLTEQHNSSSTEPRYYGKFAGNYSSLSVRFHLAREVGHYIMDYFLPSILLVVVSWVSFWLDPNAVPGRTTLGTSTMLTFITLTRNTGSALPKVSYIKATEIWFMVCTAFIFGSLVEFAFVNTIWRRKKNVELKKVNSKYILKCTFTPQMRRKQMDPNIDRCQSWPSVDKDDSNDIQFYLGNSNTNSLTVNSMDSMHTDPLPSLGARDYNEIILPVPPSNKAAPLHSTRGFTTMTPQEIAQWIDRRSRVVFPVSFILFNMLYWGFVWI